MEGVMSLKQAATELGITPDTLRQQIKAEKLTATKLGRDWFVTPAEVERYRVEHLDTHGYSKRRDAGEGQE